MARRRPQRESLLLWAIKKVTQLPSWMRSAFSLNIERAVNLWRLDARIGAERTYLSGAEQQWIILARAILKELFAGKTVLMIAHRITSVVDPDSPNAATS